MAYDREQLRREVLRVLRSEAARHFLAQLAYELTRAARDEYGPEGTMPEGSEFTLRCFNELLHRTSMQLRQVLGAAGAGFPDEVYLNILENEADVADRLDVLTSAMERALRPGSPPTA